MSRKTGERDREKRMGRWLFLPKIHIDQSDPGGIADQLMGAVKPELAHDVRTVVFNRLGAYVKSVGDFLGGKPFGE